MDTTKGENILTTGVTSIGTTQGPGVATTNGTPKVENKVPSDASGSTSPIVKPDTLGNDEKGTVHVIAEMEARNALRDVRRVINEYRDHLWEGLVTSRNLLMGTALITGLLTYVLFCFAIIAGATPAMITAATAFYLVGALIGLFGRLYDESKVDNANDDYNLTLDFTNELQKTGASDQATSSVQSKSGNKP